MVRAVADASILIHLAKVGLLNLLRHLYSEVEIPAGVFREVVERGWGLPGAKVFQLANEVEADIILVDELEVRKLARERGFRVRGCLGLLLEGVRQGRSGKKRREELLLNWLRGVTG